MDEKVPPVPKPLSTTPVPVNTPPSVLGVRVTTDPSAHIGFGVAKKHASKDVPSISVMVISENSSQVLAGKVPQAGKLNVSVNLIVIIPSATLAAA